MYVCFLGETGSDIKVFKIKVQNIQEGILVSLILKCEVEIIQQ